VNIYFVFYIFTASLHWIFDFANLDRYLVF
jgi:hypothetical protein